MALMDKKQLQEFIKENNIKTAGDIQNALKEMFKETLQEMLEAELDDDLGYAKHNDENRQTENRRNGHSKKTVRTPLGQLYPGVDSCFFWREIFFRETAV
jgi:putative transposase